MNKKPYFILFAIYITIFFVLSISLSGCALVTGNNSEYGKNRINSEINKNNNKINGAANRQKVTYYKNNYAGVLNYFTKKTNAYNFKNLSTIMFLRATYFNRQFVFAYAKKYAKYYMLNRKAFKKMLHKLYRKSDKHIKFFISVFTPQSKYNNFNSNRSIWMIYLANNKRENVLPLTVKPAEQKRAFLKAFFPYITKWSKQYIVEFPKYYNRKKKELLITKHTKWIKLIILGVKGKAVLKWNLRSN
jgi:hypothetical protein